MENLITVIGVHVSTNGLLINPCIKINKGIHLVGNEGADLRLETTISYKSNNQTVNKQVAPQVSTAILDNVIDDTYAHVHIAVTVTSAVDRPSSMTITMQLVTIAPDTTRLVVSDSTAGTYNIT